MSDRFVSVSVFGIGVYGRTSSFKAVAFLYGAVVLISCWYGGIIE